MAFSLHDMILDAADFIKEVMSHAGKYCAGTERK